MNIAPWTTAQPVYPRKVAIHRQKTVAGGVMDTIGDAGYSGAEQGSTAEGEDVLLTDLPAAIQLGSAGRATTNVGLPGINRPICFASRRA